MTDQIRCPHCGDSFALNEGVLSHLKESAAKEFRQREAALRDEFAKKEHEFVARGTELVAREKALAEKVEAEVEGRLKELKTELQASAQELVELELIDLKEQLTEKSKKLDAALQNELEMRKRERQIEERKAEQDLEVARKISEESKRIEELASKRAIEENHFRIAEKDKLIRDLQKTITDLKRQSEQGSVQAQGEVLELGLEEELRSAFPADRVLPVAKGQRGADVIHTIRAQSGRECGAIIYETKRTKAWSDSWIDKLKQDQLAAGAQISVIVSQQLPSDIDAFGFYRGVWVCDFATSIHLAATLRWSIHQVALVKLADEDRSGKAEVLYEYVTGQEFRQRVESILGHFSSMRDDLESEKRCFQRQWAKREKHLTGISQGVAEMFGAFEGIAGQIESVDSLELAG